MPFLRIRIRKRQGRWDVTVTFALAGMSMMNF